MPVSSSPAPDSNKRTAWILSAWLLLAGAAPASGAPEGKDAHQSGLASEEFRAHRRLEDSIVELSRLQKSALPMGEKAKEVQHILQNVQRMVPRHRESPLVLNSAARLTMQVGDYAAAEDMSEMAVMLARSQDKREILGQALTTRALTRWHSGRYPEAYEDAVSALKIDPRNPVAVSVAKLSKGRNPRPAELAPRGAALEAHRAELERYIAQSSPFRSPEWSRATAAIEREKGIDRLLRRGGRRLALDDPQEALREADRLIAADPSDGKGYALRALAKSGLGDAAGTVSDADRAIALGASQPFVKIIRAAGYNKLGRHGEALADMEEVLAADPRNSRAIFNRALALQGLGRDARLILAEYKRAADIDPDYAQAYERVLTRIQAGEIPDAPVGAQGTADPGRRSRGPGPLPFLILALLAGSGAAAFWLKSSRWAATPRPPPSIAADGPYEIGPLIGQGGMGAVYQARDRRLGRTVAVKRVRPELLADRGMMERLLQEARTTASLHHPNIVILHDIVEGPGRLDLVFEYVTGKTIHQILEESPGNRLALPDVLSLLSQVGEGLDYAHGRGFIHRDLKPSNIMVTEGRRVKVMDFGVARRAKDAMLTMTNTVVGTPYYMAPEQEEGQVGTACDLYALGVCAYEMLTGKLPFPGSSPLRVKREGRFTPATTHVPALPRTLDSLFTKALDPDPSGRFKTGGELVKALQEV